MSVLGSDSSGGRSETSAAGLRLQDTSPGTAQWTERQRAITPAPKGRARERKAFERVRNWWEARRPNWDKPRRHRR